MASGGDLIRLGFLRANRPLCKRELEDGTLASQPRVKFFSGYQRVEVEDIYQLGKLLDEAVDDQYCCPTTARLTQAGQRALASNGRIRRKFKPDPSEGYLEPHVARAASRVLLIDIDGIIVSDDQWREDLEGFAREAVRRFLPPRFRNVTFWASLSASAGIKRVGSNWSIGLHLVFVTDRPLEGRERQALALLGGPRPLEHLGKVDTATLLCTQMFYTARPEFRGNDPVPIRSLLVTGDSDSVTVEEDLELRLRPPAAKGRKTGRGRSSKAAGYQEKMALLGDGPELLGFHNVIRDAIFAYVVETSGKGDWEWLKSDIRRRIDLAPAKSGRESDLERYKSDTYLDDSIAGAARILESERLAPRRFQVPQGTMAEAREDMEDAIRRFGQVATWVGPPEIRQVGPNKYEAWPPFVMGLQTPTGSGKTLAAVDLVAQIVSAGRMRPIISAPNHDKCEEISEALRRMGVRAAVYRGYSALDPDADGERMCRISDDAARLRLAGVPLNKICEDCRFRETCGYRRQMARKGEVQVWVIPHALLAHRRPKHTIGSCDILIVDEDPIDAFLIGFGPGGENVSPWQLRARAEKSQPNLSRARRILASMIEAGKIDAGKFGNPRDLKRFVFSDVSELKRQLPEDRQGQLDTADVIAELLIEARIWEAIANRGVGLRIEIDKTTSGDCPNRLRLFRRAKLGADWAVDTLVLDATPEWEAYNRIWEIDETVSATADMPHVCVNQIKFSASASKFGDDKTGRNNLLRILHYIEARSANFRSTLVIAQKGLIQELRDMGIPPSVDTAHFNALRGLDRWCEVDLLIVIGRTEPPPAALQLAAEVLFDEKIDELPEGRYYPRKLVGLNLRNNEELTEAVNATYHPDWRVELLRRRAAEHELVQAIGRGRGGNRTKNNPLTMDIVGEMPLPIAIDRVINWQDAQPTPEEIIAGRYGLVLDNPSAHGASGLITALLPDVRTSRPTLYRSSRKNRSLFHLPYKISPKAVETVRPPHRPGRLLRSGARYAVPVRYRHGVWRPLRLGEVPPSRAKMRCFLGKVYVLEPMGLRGTDTANIYFEETSEK